MRCQLCSRISYIPLLPFKDRFTNQKLICKDCHIYSTQSRSRNKVMPIGHNNRKVLKSSLKSSNQSIILYATMFHSSEFPVVPYILYIRCNHKGDFKFSLYPYIEEKLVYSMKLNMKPLELLQYIRNQYHISGSSGSLYRQAGGAPRSGEEFMPGYDLYIGDSKGKGINHRCRLLNSLLVRLNIRLHAGIGVYQRKDRLIVDAGIEDCISGCIR